MKNKITLYKCDICEKEFVPDYSTWFITPFKLTYEKEENGMTNPVTRNIEDICQNCTKTIIDAFVSIKKP